MKDEEQLSAAAAQEELEHIIKRMQKIQRELRASGQPASMRELAQLKELGRAYARIVDRLADDTHDTPVA